MEKGEIILYQPNETIRLEVRLEEESVWLTQAQIAALFGIEVPAISKHIRNIYQSEELERKATVSKMEIVRQEGNRKVKRTIEIYNLDMILSIGYRVNSKNATRFRQWANQVLKDYLLKGVFHQSSLASIGTHRCRAFSENRFLCPNSTPTNRRDILQRTDIRCL